MFPLASLFVSSLFHSPYTIIQIAACVRCDGHSSKLLCFSPIGVVVVVLVLSLIRLDFDSFRSAFFPRPQFIDFHLPTNGWDDE